MTALTCGCLGAPDAPNPNPQPCPAPATQEDMLCDHCRTVACSTLTSYELDYDLGLCTRLACPEHSVISLWRVGLVTSPADSFRSHLTLTEDEKR